MTRVGPTRFEVIETYFKLIFGCVFLAYMFVVQPLVLFAGVATNRLWPIYVVAVVTGWLWARCAPRPVYEIYPTCKSQVAKK